tara:strand:- start:168 stop:983 length:816 start_codon:yes stop_codon:yes gene_type:complete
MVVEFKKALEPSGVDEPFEFRVLEYLHQIQCPTAQYKLAKYLQRIPSSAEGWASSRTILETIPDLDFCSHYDPVLRGFVTSDDFTGEVFAKLVERSSDYYQERVFTEEQARALVLVEGKQFALDQLRKFEVRKRHFESSRDELGEDSFVATKAFFEKPKSTQERMEKYHLKNSRKRELRRLIFANGILPEQILASIAEALGAPSIQHVDDCELESVVRLCEPVGAKTCHLEEAVADEINRRREARTERRNALRELTRNIDSSFTRSIFDAV